MLPLPSMDTGSKYKACCGKEICSGCIHACVIRDIDEQKCAFCRTPTADTYEAIVQRNNNRAKLGDSNAIFTMGTDYFTGLRGLPQHRAKALKLWNRAAELGHTESYFNIGQAYYQGIGVERDMKKADHYYELAAICGHAGARNNLGCSEYQAGNWDRALKHFMLAAGGGSNISLSAIQEMFRDGEATKDDYSKVLRAYQEYLGEIKSDQRDQAAAFDDAYKYY
jgi:uncharacterized protein